MSSRTADIRDSDTEEEISPAKGGTLFLWGVLIIFLVALNAFSWIFCIFVFGNPEVPFNYALLTRLNKLDNIEGFRPEDAPRGKFRTAKDLYLEQYAYTDEELHAYNALLMRAYLANYDGKNYNVVYLNGDFRVEKVRLLTKDDIFPYGVAILAQATDFPAVYVDYILPMADPASPEWKQKMALLDRTRGSNRDKDRGALARLWDIDQQSVLTEADLKLPFFAIDGPLKIGQSDTCATFLHVARLPDEKVCISVVPVVKKEMPLSETRKLQLIPPSRLNITDGNHFPLAGLPDMALPESPAQPAAPPAGAEGEDRTAAAKAP